METPLPIAEFKACVSKVQTLADGAPRIILDAPESAIGIIGTLAQAQADGNYLHVMIFDAGKWTEYVQSNTRQK